MSGPESGLSNHSTVRVVHNSQHSCIGTESTKWGRGIKASILFLNVYQIVDHVKINAAGT